MASPIKEVVLKSPISSTQHNTLYRAILQMYQDGKPVVKVEQQISGNWHPTGGSWYLKTLQNEGYNLTSADDGIWIDYGNNWRIDKGMVNVINEAQKVFDK